MASIALLGTIAGGGCDGGADDGTTLAPACVEVSPSSCAPLYTPSFDEVYTRTLVPSCASGGGSCHGNADASGAEAHGLFVDDADATHARLLQDRGDDTFVVAGDAACSSLVVRLVVDDDVLRMPVGTSLSEGEICSVAQWIENGAAR